MWISIHASSKRRIKRLVTAVLIPGKVLKRRLITVTKHTLTKIAQASITMFGQQLHDLFFPFALLNNHQIGLPAAGSLITIEN